MLLISLVVYSTSNSQYPFCQNKGFIDLQWLSSNKKR
ncbi:MAG: hypothetical protein ACI8WT_002582 [Clostridium sp.]